MVEPGASLSEMRQESSYLTPEAGEGRPNRAAGRLPELDALRSAGCLLLVAWHIVWQTARLAVPVGQRELWVAAAELLLCGAGLLAFCSGLLCFYRHPEGAPLGRFWRPRLLAVGLPFLAWSGVYLALDLLLIPSARSGVVFTLGSAALGVRHLAMAAALLQFYLLFPFLRWLWNHADRRFLIPSAFLLGIGWTEGAFRVLPEGIPPFLYSPQAGFLAGWLPYLALGALAAAHPEWWTRLAPRPRWIFQPAALLLAATLVYQHVDTVRADAEPGRLTPGLGTLAATLLLLPFFLAWSREVQATAWASVFRELSRYAPAIFFAHFLPLRLIGSVVRGQWGPWAALAIYTVGTVVGMALLIGWLSRFPVGLLLLGMGRSLKEPRERAARRYADPAGEAEWRKAAGS